jgi:hypothetical protein
VRARIPGIGIIVRQLFSGQPPFDFYLHVGNIGDEYQQEAPRDIVVKSENMILCCVGQKSVNAPTFLNNCQEVMNLLAALSSVTTAIEG